MAFRPRMPSLGGRPVPGANIATQAGQAVDQAAVKAYLDAMHAAAMANGGGDSYPQASSYGGGGYSSGGGGQVVYVQQGAPAPPPYDPATDPSYQALLSQLGLQESQARTQAAQATDRIQQQARIAAPRIAERGIEQRRGIDYGWEGRGLYESGARLRDLSIQQRGEAERQADVTLGAANKTADVQSGLEAKLGDLANQRANAAFTAKLQASR